MHRKLVPAVALVLLLAPLTFASVIHVATGNVTPNDLGSCSLIDAINAANASTSSNTTVGACTPTGTPNGGGDGYTSGNVIELAAGTYTLTQVDNTWYGPNGLPPIATTIVIVGDASGTTIARDGAAPSFRLFYVGGGQSLSVYGPPTGFPNVPGPGDLTLVDLTLTGGIAQGTNGGAGAGGGMGAGGAIYNQGTLTIRGATISDNQAIGGNGGSLGTGSFGGGMGLVLGNYAGEPGANGQDGASGGIGAGTGGAGSPGGPDGDGGGGGYGGNGGDAPAVAEDGTAGGNGGAGGAGHTGGRGGNGGTGGDGGGGGNGGLNVCVQGGDGGGFGGGGAAGAGGVGGGGGAGGYAGFGGSAGYAGTGMCDGGGYSASGQGGSTGYSGGAGGRGGFGGGGGAGGAGGRGGYSENWIPGFGSYGGAGGPGGFGGGGGGGGHGGDGGGQGDSSYIIPSNHGRPGGAGAAGGFGGGQGADGDPGAAGFDDPPSPNRYSGAGGGGAGFGGAIFNEGGTVRILNSTITANAATGGTGGGSPATGGKGYGGAIFNLNGTTDVRLSTLAANSVSSASSSGDNLYNYYTASPGSPAADQNNPNVATFASSIALGPLDGSGTATNCETNGSFTSGGDVVGVPGSCTFGGTDQTADPLLSALASNGGPTQTLALDPNSPAIDAVANCTDWDGNAVTTDQRGIARPPGGPCDAGAYETVRFHVASAGNGNGTMTGTGISCNVVSGATSGTCSKFEPVAPTSESVTANPGSDSIFTGWSGDCSDASTTTSATVAGETTCVATFVAVADLSIDKTLVTPGPYTVYQVVDYTITVTNGGPGVAGDVVVTDSLPPQLDFVSASPSTGSCGESGGTVTCNLGDLALDGVATVTLSARIRTAGTFHNIASVATSSSDPVSANSSAEASAEATQPAIPAVNGLGLGALALLLAIAAAIVLRR